MDAMLWELLSEGEPDDIVEVLVRVSELPELPIDRISIVAQIGDILSCRIKRSDILLVYENDAIVSMKAQRFLYLDPPLEEDLLSEWTTTESDNNASKIGQLPFDGSCVCIGIADWGFDFTHPNFLNEDGSTRFVSIWDQGAAYDGQNVYGYGKIFLRDDINNALKSINPFETLGYFPSASDLTNVGMHGTHVLDIAAGNGSVGARGIAPSSDLLAVHLSTSVSGGLLGLGISVRVFDALHQLHEMALESPLVINISVGSHGDAHLGRSLIEQAIDHLVTRNKGRAIVQSCGNYFTSRVHTEGVLKEHSSESIDWLVSVEDKTSNELEIWYEPEDEISINLEHPNGKNLLAQAGIGLLKISDPDGREIGRYYHRKNEPNTNLNQVLIILDEEAGAGRFVVTLVTRRIVRGLYHSWIERDRGNLNNQSRFSHEQSKTNTTTGSICNGFHNICVGAYNNRGDNIRPAFFSSVGPTRDGRVKPDFVAPGVGIVAAKSTSPSGRRSNGELTAKTGTSMAAPFIAGAVALIYQSANRLLSIDEVLVRLRSAAKIPSTIPEVDRPRFGYGIVELTSLFDPVEKILDQSSLTNQIHFMEPDDDVTMSLDDMMQISCQQFPELNDDSIIYLFERLEPGGLLIGENELRRGDIIIRRQYAHHEGAYFGVVASVDDKSVILHTPAGRRNIRFTSGDHLLNWDLKRIRPQYSARYGNKQISKLYEDAYEPAENFDIVGTPSNHVSLSWAAPRAAKGRVYYVTSGGNGQRNSPIKFEISQVNTGSRYARLSGWAVALRLMGQGQPNTLVGLTGQKSDFLKIPDDFKLDAGATRMSDLRVSLQDINKAYRNLNLDDPRMQFEAQLYWSERDENLIYDDELFYHYNRVYCDFYLVNPVEFIETDEIYFEQHIFSDHANISHVNIRLKGVRKKIKYPAQLNDLKEIIGSYGGPGGSFTLTTGEAEVNTDTMQVTVSISEGESKSQSDKLSVKTSQKATFGIEAAPIKAGTESATEIGAEYQTTVTNSHELSRSFMNSNTTQKSFSTQKSETFTVPATRDVIQFFLKPIFKPVAVRVIRFTNIDANGVAHLRTEDDKPMIIWQNAGYHFYQQKQKVQHKESYGEDTGTGTPSGQIKAGNEIDLASFQKTFDTKYGTWTTSTILKTATSVSGSSGLEVGGQFTQTSKLQNGERVMGAKQEFSYAELKDVFKNLKIENFSLKIGGEWSGTEISAYGVATFEFVTSMNRTPVSLKIFVFKVKEGDGVKIGEVEGYFDSPSFDIKVEGVLTKVFIRYKVSWKLDKAKVAKEVFEKIAREKLESEAKKQGVKMLGRKAGEGILKKLGPIVTAFGIGWDIGTLLNNYTVADEIALSVQQEILGDLNVQYQNASTFGKVLLIAKNSPKIIVAMIASGVAGAVAGIGDLVLFKLFGLDKLKDFEAAFKALGQLLEGIPNVGGGFVDMIMGEVLKMGIKMNPQYFMTNYVEVRTVATKIFATIRPIYKTKNGLDTLVSIRMYDFDIDYQPIVDLLIKRNARVGNILNLNQKREQIISDLLEVHLAEFIRLLELNNLIAYKFNLNDELGTNPLDQRLVNELFL